MVAIFTGAGAGFVRGSANILGGAGQLGGSLLGRGGESISVNAANGNLLVSHQDEFLVGRGPDIGISRTYNSLAETGDGDNGDQWQQSTTRRIFGLTGTANTAGSTVSRLSGDANAARIADRDLVSTLSLDIPQVARFDITRGQSLSSYTPSLWTNITSAVRGRQHGAYAQWNAGGLGYLSAPIEFVMSPVTGGLDLASSYYRGRGGWVAPADRQTVDTTLLALGGAEMVFAKGIGTSRLAGVAENGGIEALYQARYASAYERGVSVVDQRLAAGRIKAPVSQPAHLFRANQIDNFARQDLKAFALMQGHGADMVRINQRLYLDNGRYRVPDVYFPQSGMILDGTLGFKSARTRQIIDFRAANNNAPIGIIRPESYGGSYWIGQ